VADAVTPPTTPGAVAAVDLGVPRAVHVVGVGGAGMSAIAGVLSSMGHRVSGSDLKASTTFDRLLGQGIDVRVGHDAANVGAQVELVTRSTAIPDSNVEVVAARARGIDVLSRAEILAAIAAQRSTVAVAGTHGKTTTSSMLALVLVEAGMHPSFIIGGDENEIGTGAVWDDGEWFVIEADESDGTFLTIPRRAAIVTNVEADHLEHWGGYVALEAAFARFLQETDGPRVVCADDENAWRLSRDLEVTTYGTHERADYRMVGVTRTRTGTSFELWHEGSKLGEVRMPIAGMHNASNAAAAIVTALLLGAPFEAGRTALAKFAGVARRFQYRGEVHGITFIDDYAHLPTEVEAALSAAADGQWNRVVCVFQPHRYSRTASLWRTFGDAFRAADVLVLTDIYSSGETPRPGVSGHLLVQAVLDAHPWARVVYLPHRADIVQFLSREMRAGDLCLTLGAGDLTTVPDDVLARLHEQGAR
jgi:UDP-N-acetylmuramate--alanine ligase